MSKVNINELDLEHLEEVDELNKTFVKIPKGKKFDDGTRPSKYAKKRGSNRIVEDEAPEVE